MMNEHSGGEVHVQQERSTVQASPQGPRRSRFGWRALAVGIVCAVIVTVLIVFWVASGR